MTYEFTANKIEADEGQRLIGFADDEHYVWMQPDDDFDSPSFDADNVWIEIHDQQFGGRGGIRQVRLTRQRLSISLMTAKAKKMRGRADISVAFVVTDGQFEQLTVLQSVMRGSESLLEIDG